jgi:hypothetical protein
MIVGGNRARRWTPTQQPPDDSSPLRRKAAGGPLRSGWRNYRLATAFTPLLILHFVYFYAATSSNTKQGRK